MEHDTKTKINKIIVELSKQEGEVIPIAQVVKYAKDEGIEEADVLVEIKTLVDEGMISQLDKTSIQLDM